MTEAQDTDEQFVEDHTDHTQKKQGCSCTPIKNAIWAEGSKTEVQAFYFNSFGRSILFVSVTFLSLAILELANKQAGCPTDEDGAYQDCGNRVYGSKPSSILTLMAVVGGVMTAMFMPYAGAVVDYTSRRREFGVACAATLVIANFVQIFLFDSTWFAFAIIQAVLASASFFGNAMVIWSYVKDSSESDHVLHGITASGRLWDTFGMFGYLLMVTLVGIATGWGSVSLARFSQALAVVLGGVSLWASYSRYGPRPAQKILPEGKSLYLAGISSLYSTITDLGKTAPGAKRLLIGVMFVDSATGSFSTLGVTYLKEQINMTDLQTQIFFITTLICGIPGALFHRTVARRIGHKRGFLACITYWIVITILFVLILSGPGKGNLSYLFAILFGIGFGWYYPSLNGFFVSLVPDGRDVELWGWNIFASVVLSWVPPLIFTGLNETVDDLRLGMVSLISFHFIGLLISCTIDDRHCEEKSDVPELKKEDPISDEEKGRTTQREDTFPAEEELVDNVSEDAISK